MYKSKIRKLLISLSLFTITFGVLWNVHARNSETKSAKQSHGNAVTVDDAKTWIKNGERLKDIPKDTWEQLLDESAFHVMWQKGTERAFSGDLLDEKRDGVFVTSGCRIPVFKSDHKFKSGTGWPSFWEVFKEGNIILKEDRSWGMRRVEVLSACGEHLGHVFDDGPEPTGLRYCINSAALAFIPSGEADKLGPFLAE